jgi:hypothetical protein
VQLFGALLFLRELLEVLPNFFGLFFEGKFAHVILAFLQSLSKNDNLLLVRSKSSLKFSNNFSELFVQMLLNPLDSWECINVLTHALNL